MGSLKSLGDGLAQKPGEGVRGMGGTKRWWVFGCRKDEGREGLAGAEGTPLPIHRPDRPVPLPPEDS